MGSYEEMVVDRSVESAWLQFRVRLADHLASMRANDTVVLAVVGLDDSFVVELTLRSVNEAGRVARWEWADGRDRRGAAHGRTVRVSSRLVDSYVSRVHDVLVAEGVVHPAFVQVHGADLVLIDPPPQIVAPAVAPAMPESIVATSPNDLRLWLDRVLVARLGREPHQARDGSVTLSRDEGRVTVRLSSTRPIIEVHSTVARDVDVRRARKQVAQMNARFHFFSFALVGDRVVVTTTVNAHPFCPDHLNRAIDSTFGYLERDAPRLQAKVARRSTSAGSADGVDPDLLMVFGAAGDRAGTIALVRSLSSDSPRVMHRWRKTAGVAAGDVRARIATTTGPAQGALIDQVVAWSDVVEALTDAMDLVADERAAS